MDEPFSALDSITRSSLQEELFTLQNELNKTIIFVTHDMDEALAIADKICIMDKGKVAQNESQVIDVFTIDGLVKKLNVKLLEDDKQFFTPYYAIHMVNDNTLEK